MANWTKAQLRDEILEHIGVKAAGESASTEDATRTEAAIDAAHDRLNKFGLVPFPTSAIPPWAQTPLRDYVAVDVKPGFGYQVARLPNGESPEQKAAERELSSQVSAHKPNKRIRAEYF